MQNLWIKHEDLESLLWKSCRNCRVFWIFTERVRELAEKMKANGGSIRIGDWIYEFRCNQKFIVRIPAKRG